MANSPVPWQAHEASNYDSAMKAKCCSLLNKIASDSTLRQSILSDPRNLHRDLFESFAPLRHREYAGNYRGSSCPSLVNRTISSASQINPSTTYGFCAPDTVPARMHELLTNTHDLFNSAHAQGTDFEKLLVLAYTFSWFGKIHPFLDGNGHVQRAIFAVMATEFGYPLSARFAIHPRPYDRLLAIALEIFTRAPVGSEAEQLPLVAEYLAFFLDGPFNALRKNVATTTPPV